MHKTSSLAYCSTLLTIRIHALYIYITAPVANVNLALISCCCDPGDMWSGSEGGVIKIWPWESIEKSLSLKPEERHMAALLVERSCIDLRSQVTVNGVCSISSQDVKCLLADNFRARVWCAGSLSFSLWLVFDLIDSLHM